MVLAEELLKLGLSRETIGVTFLIHALAALDLFERKDMTRNEMNDELDDVLEYLIERKKSMTGKESP